MTGGCGVDVGNGIAVDVTVVVVEMIVSNGVIAGAAHVAFAAVVGGALGGVTTERSARCV